MQTAIKEAIEQALHTLGITEVDFVVEHPGDVSHGDYATNVAMAAAKVAKENPRQLAERILELLREQAVCDRIEVAGPGFINFHLNRDFFTTEIARVRDYADNWGRNDLLAEKTYIVEYTDPNPFKEFHIGHLFTNSVGESLSRLIEFSGATVRRACYQGDVGMHVAHAIWGMQQLGLSAEAEFTARDLGKAYATGATAYKTNDVAKTDIKALNKKIYERSDETVNALYDKGRQVSLAYFESLYRQLGTHFDEYFFESAASAPGVTLVKNHPEVFVDSDGAKVFVGEPYGLHTRVFLNSEGLPTYEAKELALAKMKEERFGEYDHSIVSTSNEINEYFKVLKQAMSFIYPELAAKTEHVGHGTVRLSTGKMSSRTGDVIAAIDFITEIADVARQRIATTSPELAHDEALATTIALGAIKFATLKGSIFQDSVFNSEEALSFEGATGPYLQYTHARINSVLAKAAEVGVTASIETVPELPYELERYLYRFPEVVAEAMEERLPHKVAQYLIELAGAFNTFYGEEKIADPTDTFAPYKAALTAAVGQTLKNGLWLLGIEAPERM